MRVLAPVESALLLQRGYLFPWAPVCLALGIGCYFALTWEPEFIHYVVALPLAALTLWIGNRRPGAWSPVATAAALIALGFVLAGNRANQVAEPVLKWRYYGPVEGRVVDLDRSASDRLRVTLDRVRLSGMPQSATPARVRISLHGEDAMPVPGQRIMTTGHLSPPQGPVEPGGFDFRRHAWFKRLGGVGYTRNPVLTVSPPQEGRSGLRIFALRMAASAHVRSVLPGEAGGFAAAITTGDRSGVSKDTLQDLRASNLAHLLAISGLHMGLLTGFVFAVLRVALNLIPALALRVPVKKLAAVGALIAAAGYLALSGGNVATERAFIMVAVMLCAVLVDRRALSLRAVAVAAIIVLILRPEALLSPGFQMSFAATAALVAVFGWIRDLDILLGPKWFKPVAAVVISSAVAGLATAPIGAAHFNTMAHFGLLANLLSVSLMGILVIPAAVLALCLAPLGLDWIGLYLMEFGLHWILGVAHFVSGLDGAQGYVSQPGPSVLPLIALGSLWVILWRGRPRILGLAPMAGAFALWAVVERPAVLVAENGGLVGGMTDQGRALSKSKGSGFVASVWLENDGDGADQIMAAARLPVDGKLWVYDWNNRRIVHVAGKRAAREPIDCEDGAIIVSAVPLSLSGTCTVFDPDRLRDTGSLSFGSTGIETANAQTGVRLWNPHHSQDMRLALSKSGDQ